MAKKTNAFEQCSGHADLPAKKAKKPSDSRFEQRLTRR